MLPQPEFWTDLDTRVLLTLTYCTQFDYPLSAEEVWQRLINTRQSRQTSVARLDLAATRSEVEAALVRLALLGVIDKQHVEGSVYYGSSRVAESQRWQRQRWSIKKWLEVNQFLKLITWLPWIRGVVITGSLAMNNTRENDDVDFMLVVAPHRLWLARIVVTFLAWLKGKRRTWRAEEPNSWCFNMWVSQNQLAVHTPYRTIYTAYEVCQAVAVWGAEDVASNFLTANRWAEHFLAHYFAAKKKSLKKSNHLLAPPNTKPVNWSRALRWGLSIVDWWLAPLLYILDLVAYLAQRVYMSPHKTRERVGLLFAMFHPRDTHALIVINWQAAVSACFKNRLVGVYE